MLGKVLLVHRWVGCFFFFAVFGQFCITFSFNSEGKIKICINMHLKKKKKTLLLQQMGHGKACPVASTWDITEVPWG